MEPLVSILIPVYNRFEMVVQAIDSALSQTYGNIEIIVGDNYSLDGTYEKLCKKYCASRRVIVFQNAKNVGPVLNWIECLKRAKGEFIKFLWSDDLMAPTYISETMKVLCCNPEVSFAYSKTTIFKSNISDVVNKDCYSLGHSGIYEAKVFFDSLVYAQNAPCSPGCAIFRKDTLAILSSFPGSDEAQVIKTGAGVDLLMFLLALERKPRFYYIDETLAFFRWHSGSITVSNQKVPMGYICAQKYFFEKFNYLNYIKWIRAKNRLLALKRRIKKEENYDDYLNYCKKIGMMETGFCNIRIHVLIIMNHIKNILK